MESVAGWQRPFQSPSDMLRVGWGANAMFDVYLNDRRDLLVVRKRFPIPAGYTSGRWRKRKKKVLNVSEEIRIAIQSHGYYMRKLRDLNKEK
jgi:hypothetical protein